MLDEDGEGFFGDGDAVVLREEVARDLVEVGDEGGELERGKVVAEEVANRVADVDRVGD